MSQGRKAWFSLSLALTATTLMTIGYGLFNVGTNDPSNQVIYSFGAAALFNWLAYFGSHSCRPGADR
jgi:hypothetical protein